MFSVIAFLSKKTTVKTEIVFEDENVNMKNGIIYAKGFSNEPFKINKDPIVISEETVLASKLSDGLSKMSNGNLEVKKDITCRGFSDGTLNIKGGSLTTSGSLTTDDLVVNRSLDFKAQNFADIVILDMQPISFDHVLEWRSIATNTKSTQFFFPGSKDLHHGVSIESNNRVQFHKLGKWSFRYMLDVDSRENTVSVSSCFGNYEDNNKIADGRTRGRGTIQLTGFGILNVINTAHLFDIAVQHDVEPTEMGLEVTGGHLVVIYLGK